MKNTFFKSSVREIRKNLGRFLSIFSIAAIGVGFFAGVRASKPDMTDSADKYYVDQKLMDICISSPDGFTVSDIELIIEQTNAEVAGAYYADCLYSLSGKESAARFYSLIENINIPELTEGRLPENERECVAAANSLKADIHVGDTVKLTDNNADALKFDEYTVVGLVNSAMCVSASQFGTTDIGNGQISTVFFVSNTVFTSATYNQLWIYCDFLRRYNTYSDEYKRAVDDITERLDNIAENRLKSIMNGSYDYRLLNISKYNAELGQAVDEVYDSKEKLEQTNKELTITKNYIDRTEQLISEKSEQLSISAEQIQNSIDAELKSYEQQLQSAMKLKAEADALEVSYKELETEYYDTLKKADEVNLRLSAIENVESEEYNSVKKERDELINKSDELKKQYDAKKAEYDKKISEYETEYAKYDTAYSASKEAYNKLIDDSGIGGEEIMQMSLMNQMALAEYNQKVELYNAAYEQLNGSLSDVITAVSDIYSYFSKLWYISDRSDLPANAEYGENAERIGNIAKVFPAFFLLVAALVCLTTMTRMVDEQRTEIGTLKALGYSNAVISLRYVAYALCATLLGCALGLAVGFVLFPRVIMSAYTIIYTVPVMLTPFRWGEAIADTAVMSLCVTAAVFIACHGEFANCPNDLMRPKAPPKGKRILLERITFIWKSLPFTQKVTARNIFRYKKKMLMTVIGVAGCTALLVTGFGLKDSITDIVELQFSKIWQYDATVYFKDSAEAEDSIKASGCSSYLLTEQRTCTAENNGKSCEVIVTVPDNKDSIGDFILLSGRTADDKYSLNDSGCIITEKAAKLLGVSVGDSISIETSDGSLKSVAVNAVTENYAYHYVYISAEKYADLFEEEPVYNTALCKYSGTDSDEFAEKLLKSDNIVNVTLNQTTRDTFDDIIMILNIVVLVLIISAGALAFVVQFSLANINITERKREIATLKVLGFTRKETGSYIFRENLILTLFGTVFGLVFGYFLAMFVINTAEIDMVMFGRNIHPLSFVYSAVLTVVFTLFIGLFTRRKTEKISMTESLKSIE